jgi:hypothetical protein
LTTATNSAFAVVNETPLQTGGYTDNEMVDIFLHGQIPVGGYFDDTIVSRSRWSQFHLWSMSTDQAQGVVAYMRSLVPSWQKGISNLPPRIPPDAGSPVDGGVADTGAGD